MVRSLVRIVALATILAGCASPGATASPSVSVLPSAPPPTNPPASEQPSSVPPSDGSPVLGEPIGGIACDRGGHDDAFHVHSLLAVASAGGNVPPPADIGITDTCLYWVHTHAADGVIHVEAPSEVQPTLGDFLAIWEGTYPDDSTLAAALEFVDAGAITVDGAPPVVGTAGYDGDPRHLILGDRTLFVLGP